MTCSAADLVVLYAQLRDDADQFTSRNGTPIKLTCAGELADAIAWRIQMYMYVINSCGQHKIRLGWYAKWALDAHIPIVNALEAHKVTTMCDVYDLKLCPIQQSAFPLHANSPNKKRFEFNVLDSWLTSKKDVKKISRESLVGMVCPIRRSSRQIIKLLHDPILEDPTSNYAVFFMHVVKLFLLGNAMGKVSHGDFAYRRRVYDMSVEDVYELCHIHRGVHVADFALYELLVTALERNLLLRHFVGRFVDVDYMLQLTHTLCNVHIRPAVYYNYTATRATRDLIALHMDIPCKKVYYNVFDYLYELTLQVKLPTVTRKQFAAAADVFALVPASDIDMIQNTTLNENNHVTAPLELSPIALMALKYVFEQTKVYWRMKTRMMTLPYNLQLAQSKAVSTQLHGRHDMATVAVCVGCALLRLNPIGNKAKKKINYLYLDGLMSEMLCDQCMKPVQYVPLIGKVLSCRVASTDPLLFIRITLCTRCSGVCVLSDSTTYCAGEIVCSNCTRIERRTIEPQVCFMGCPLDKKKDRLDECTFIALDDNGYMNTYAYCHRHLVHATKHHVVPISTMRVNVAR